MKVDTTQVLVETQFKVDKGSSTVTYETVGTFASAPIYIILDRNPTNPPTNWVLGNVYTIQVGNTGTGSPPLVPNTTYYCKYIDTQAIKVLSTRDPNSSTLDSSGITSVLIPIGSTSVIRNSTLSDNLTLTNDTNTSILTSTDLIFNGSSVPSSISTLQIKQTNAVQVYSSPAIYADGRPPLAVPSSPSNTFAQFGWYFKNSIAGKKVNWYLPNVSSLKVSDIDNLTFDATLFSASSPPFIQFYTQKTATGNAGSWYKARTTYSVADTSKVSTYKDYQFSTLKANDTPLIGKT
jgi:hypothetical protein